MLKKTIESLTRFFGPTPQKSTLGASKPRPEPSFEPNRFLNLSRNFEYAALSEPDDDIEHAISELFKRKLQPPINNNSH